MTRLSKWIVFTTASFFFIWTALIGAVLWRLMQGPLDLSPYEKTLISVISRLAPNAKTSFSRPQLYWQGYGHPLEISLQNLTVHAQNIQLTTSKVVAHIRLRSLAFGNVLPTILLLEEPNLKGTFTPDLTDKKPSSLYQTIQDLWRQEDSSKLFKRVIISQGKATLNVQDQASPLIFQNIFLTLNRTKQGIWLSSYGDGPEGLAWKSYSHYDRSSEELWTDTKMDGVLPAFFSKFTQADLYPGLKIDNALRINFHLKGAMGALGTGSLKGDITPGLIEWQSPDTALKIPLKQGGIHYIWTKNTHFIEVLDLLCADGHLKAQGILEKKSDAYDFKISLILKDFSINQVKNYWPQTLAQSARGWVIDHIPQGKIPQATLYADGSLKGSNPMQLKGLGGTIDLQDATVIYMTGMPPVKNMAVQARYSPQNLLITLLKGTSHQQTITKGHVNILDLDKKDQNIAIEFQASGPLEHALRLINEPALALMERLGSQIKVHQGQQDSLVSLLFPLKETLDMKEIKTKIETTLKNVSLELPVSQKMVPLTKGSGRLSTSSEAITFKGAASLYGEPADITWRQNITPSPIPMELSLKSRCSKALLKAYYPQGLHYIDGTPPFTLNLKETPAGHIDIAFSGNLARSTLVLGSWRRFQNAPSSFDFKGTFKNGDLSALHHMVIKGDGLDVALKGQFYEDGTLKSLFLERGKLGLTDIKGALDFPKTPQHIKRFSLYGSLLDLEPFWDLIFLKEEHGDKNQKWQGRLQSDEIRLKKGQTLYHARFTLEPSVDHNGPQVSFLAFSQKNQSGRVYLTLEPQSHNKRALKLSVQNGGDFLRQMDIFKNVLGGTLTLDATQMTNTHDAPWQGFLRMNDFQVKKVPFLGRLLSLAFPTGFGDFVRGNKISFEALKIKFQANSHKVSIQSGKAYGASLGFTVFGTLDHDLQTLNLSGSIIPAYFLNTLLSKIPLLGQVLTGGKNEGLLGVAYRLKGPLSNIQLSVNPMSALAPGFLRRLFMDENPEDLESTSLEKEPNPQSRSDT